MGTLPRKDESVGALLSALATDTGELARQELRLASFEVIDRARTASGEIGVVALGGALAHAGLLGILTAVAIALSNVIPLWTAALLLGAVFFAAGYAIVMKGLHALEQPLLSETNNSAPRMGTTAAKDGLR